LLFSITHKKRAREIKRNKNPFTFFLISTTYSSTHKNQFPNLASKVLKNYQKTKELIGLKLDL